MEPIRISSVTHAVPGKTLLHDLNLTLGEGRIGLIGRNGSGKTTLLRLMAGLVAPSSGTIRLGDTDPFADRKAALAKIGILFQNPDHQILFPTVLEELAFGLIQQGHPRAMAEDAVRARLKAEGRAHWESAATHSLSQGQKQYLCLLAILMMQPDTLLLDEPFAGLDLPTQARLERRLADLPQRLVTISHDPASVRACDRVIWLEAGRLRMDGPAAPVIAAFEQEMAQMGAADADTDIGP